MRVYIAQLKCPSNHCIVAAVEEYESDEAAQALVPEVERKFQELTKGGTVRKTCGICGSSDLHIDMGRTRFASLKEAAPHLFEQQMRQFATMDFLRRSRN